MKFTFCFLLCYISISLSAQIITTFAGNGTVGFSGNGGPATSAQLYDPQTVCADNAGNVFVADLDNHVVWKINSANIISIFAGTGILGSSGDGGPASAAKIGYPYGICSDIAGNIYISDQYSETIRKIDVTGNISTIAGNGISGYSGDGGLAISAQLNAPCAICVDLSGNIFVAEFGNQVIRKISNSGIITTVAGTGMLGYSGDGGLATLAMLNSPTGVSVDNAGNIYIADEANSAIRKVDAAGIITTFAGGNGLGYSGDGGPPASAILRYPYFVYVDGNGNVYISDTGNGVLRMVNSSGIISTIAGDGVIGYSGDGGLATSARLTDPGGICIDNLGNIYVADAGVHVVRKINTCLTAVINLQPTDANLCSSGDTSFTINAGNVTNYQWQANTGTGWNDISNNAVYSGASTAQLKITGANTSLDSFQYRCNVTNSCGNIYSSIARLTIITPAQPSISVSTVADTVCAGSTVIFTASTLNGGSAPLYQWKKNGINVATGSTFTSGNIADGDIITCVLTSNSNCIVTNTAVSNAITMKVNPVLTPSINISSSATSICSGTPVSFTSVSLNKGSAPSYQWKKNGINTGTGSPVYLDSTLNDNDIITCQFTSNYSCLATASAISNNIVMKVTPTDTPSISITSSAISICKGASASFIATMNNGGISPVYNWQKNGLSVGANSNVYTDAAISNGDVINCTLTSNAACLAFTSAISNSITMTVFNNPIVALDKTNTLCAGQSRVLDAGNYNSWLWNNGSANRTLSVSNTGTYYVLVTDNNGCRGTDTTFITAFLPSPAGFLPPSDSICSYGTLVLKPNSPYKNYLWSTNSNSSSITINTPRLYWLQVTDNNNCAGRDSVVIALKNCMEGFYIPDAFTPNHDGKNDIFKPLLFGNIQSYRFIVYNRFGQKVFETSNPSTGWDGTIRGITQDSDIFVWICSFQLSGSLQETKKGSVMLIR